MGSSRRECLIEVWEIYLLELFMLPRRFHALGELFPIKCSCRQPSLCVNLDSRIYNLRGSFVSELMVTRISKDIEIWARASVVFRKNSTRIRSFGRTELYRIFLECLIRHESVVIVETKESHGGTMSQVDEIIFSGNTVLLYNFTISISIY